MNFETLKKDDKSKYIIGLIVISAIVVTITYVSTRAKYRVTNSVQLASGVINYSPSDLEIVAIKIQNDFKEYDNTDTIPTSGYYLNTEKSICKVGETKQDVTITYENGKINLDNLTIKGTKCEIYFDKLNLLVIKNVNNNWGYRNVCKNFTYTYQIEGNDKVELLNDENDWEIPVGATVSVHSTVASYSCGVAFCKNDDGNCTMNSDNKIGEVVLGSSKYSDTYKITGSEATYSHQYIGGGGLN